LLQTSLLAKRPMRPDKVMAKEDVTLNDENPDAETPDMEAGMQEDSTAQLR